jgi:hypothetical protein
LSTAGVVTNSAAGLLSSLAGTTTTVLHGNAAGAPTYSAVSLTADVSGVLPTANGGAKSYTCTLDGAALATCTAVVASGVRCTCNDTEPAVLGVGALACSVSGTTATVTSGVTLDTSIVTLVCAAP